MKAARKTLASDIFVPNHKPHLHYRKKWVRTHKKVGTNKLFFPCKPYLGFGAIGGYGPKTEKKKKLVRTPFAVRKRCVNAPSFRTIFFM